MARSGTVAWTRAHSLVAMNLYHKLPFGKLHKGNPLIIEVAQKMGRTASSLAMKLSNLASLDPVLKARGIKGLPGVSRADRAMWLEFHNNVQTLAPESEQLLHDLFTSDPQREVDFLDRQKVRVVPSVHVIELPAGPTEVHVAIKARRGQQFFRQTVLNAYGVQCCVSGITVPRLLVASHIRPWRDFPNDRLNVRNGLCLSSLHDAAFDSGLITFDDDRRLVVSKRLKDHLPQTSIEQNFVAFEGSPMRGPEQIAEPDDAFLKHHREHVFVT